MLTEDTVVGQVRHGDHHAKERSKANQQAGKDGGQSLVQDSSETGTQQALGSVCQR